MKTIIISDIKSKYESIIPYGLNFARVYDSEIDILHVIDTRSVQGVPSSYADSHTVSPGGKQSTDVILNKEKKQTADSLSAVVTREVSRIHFHHRPNIIIEEESIVSKLEKFAGEDKSQIVIASNKPDGVIFETEKEILKILKKSGIISVLVPPGQKFNKFENVLIVSDFAVSEFDKHREIFSFLKIASPLIKAVALPGDNREDAKKRSGEWLETAAGFVPRSKISACVFMENSHEEMQDYIDSIDPDVVISIRTKHNFLEKLTGTPIKFEKALLEGIGKPFIIHGDH